LFLGAVNAANGDVIQNGTVDSTASIVTEPVLNQQTQGGLMPSA